METGKTDGDATRVEGSNQQHPLMAGHLDAIKVYAWLQKQHEALADVLAEKIREIKAEGLFDEYQKQLGVCCKQSATIPD